MKVLVFGSGGMLGTDLVPVWRACHQVLALSHAECDISDMQAVNSVLGLERPDLVLLLAAATDVDRCEQDHAYAFRANAIGPDIVAQACRKAGSALAYASSIAVFSGEKDSPYDEYDLPSPANLYGLSKYHGESAVRTFCPDHWVVRTGWLYGGGARDVKFVARILRKASMDQDIRVVRDCIGSPTFTGDFAEGLLRLVEGFPFGTYHLVNGGVPASRSELGRETLSVAGYSPEMVLPCLSSEIDLPAPRPRMEAATSMKLSLAGNRLVLPDWKESLAGYIRGTLGELMQ